MCKGGWIEYAGGNYPVKLQKYKNDVKYLQIFRGGGIESAGGNYRVKLPPQSPHCGVWLVMRKRGISTPSLFPLHPPYRPLLYEANPRRDHWAASQHKAPLHSHAINPSCHRGN